MALEEQVGVCYSPAPHSHVRVLICHAQEGVGRNCVDLHVICQLPADTRLQQDYLWSRIVSARLTNGVFGFQTPFELSGYWFSIIGLFLGKRTMFT